MPDGTTELEWLLQYYEQGAVASPPPPAISDTREILVSVGGIMIMNSLNECMN
jgi:hypothetical protein